MAIRITGMSPEDIRAVTKLANSAPELATGTDTPDFYSEPTLRRLIQSANSATFVARHGLDTYNEKVVGFLLGQALPGTRDAYIHCTVMAPDFRKQGIASELTKVAEERFIELGCNHVFSVIALENFPMLAVKRRLGYSIGLKPMVYVDKMIGEVVTS